MVSRSTIDLALRSGTEALGRALGGLSDLGYARARMPTSANPLKAKFGESPFYAPR
jgi:hypothetical protein